jgi:hypothetical protein
MAFWGTDSALAERAKSRSWAGRVKAPSIVPDPPTRDRHQPPFDQRPFLPPCPELDCVRSCLSAGTIAFAELRAAELGVGADRVLVANGLIDEDAYLMAVAHQLGIPFETLETSPVRHVRWTTIAWSMRSAPECCR